MAEPPPGSDADDSAEIPRPSRRKLTMAEVFGDVLPDETSDERAPDPREDEDVDARERDLLRDVPPHHQ